MITARFVAFFLLLHGAGFVATAANADSDPWEPVNRRIFVFNETLDTYALKPLSVSYARVVPAPARTSVRNFFYNLNDINVFINDVLQMKLADAASDSGRFVVNTTAGVGGLFDVASRLGLERNQEDFGQTFGAWGLEPGPYLMLPLFGPSSVRDAIGFVLDTLTNPLSYVDKVAARNGLLLLRQIQVRTDSAGLEDMMMGDHYLFLREGYLQQRAFVTSDGEYYDDFDDF
ncbi:MAG: VacJ family lipoprotein [Pseudomonadales bacterium]|nr:VacJ family lipoprotein [Pseudomonadales bacterium]